MYSDNIPLLNLFTTTSTTDTAAAMDTSTSANNAAMDTSTSTTNFRQAEASVNEQLHSGSVWTQEEIDAIFQPLNLWQIGQSSGDNSTVALTANFENGSATNGLSTQSHSMNLDATQYDAYNTHLGFPLASVSGHAGDQFAMAPTNQNDITMQSFDSYMAATRAVNKEVFWSITGFESIDWSIHLNDLSWDEIRAMDGSQNQETFMSLQKFASAMRMVQKDVDIFCLPCQFGIPTTIIAMLVNLCSVDQLRRFGNYILERAEERAQNSTEGPNMDVDMPAGSSGMSQITVVTHAQDLSPTNNEFMVTEPGGAQEEHLSTTSRVASSRLFPPLSSPLVPLPSNSGHVPLEFTDPANVPLPLSEPTSPSTSPAPSRQLVSSPSVDMTQDGNTAVTEEAPAAHRVVPAAPPTSPATRAFSPPLITRDQSDSETSPAGPSGVGQNSHLSRRKALDGIELSAALEKLIENFDRMTTPSAATASLPPTGNHSLIAPTIITVGAAFVDVPIINLSQLSSSKAEQAAEAKGDSVEKLSTSGKESSTPSTTPTSVSVVNRSTVANVKDEEQETTSSSPTSNQAQFALAAAGTPSSTNDPRFSPPLSPSSAPRYDVAQRVMARPSQTQQPDSSDAAPSASRPSTTSSSLPATSSRPSPSTSAASSTSIPRATSTASGPVNEDPQPAASSTVEPPRLSYADKGKWKQPVAQMRFPALASSSVHAPSGSESRPASSTRTRTLMGPPPVPAKALAPARGSTLAHVGAPSQISAPAVAQGRRVIEAQRTESPAPAAAAQPATPRPAAATLPIAAGARPTPPLPAAALPATRPPPNRAPTAAPSAARSMPPPPLPTASPSAAHPTPPSRAATPSPSARPMATPPPPPASPSAARPTPPARATTPSPGAHPMRPPPPPPTTSASTERPPPPRATASPPVSAPRPPAPGPTAAPDRAPSTPAAPPPPAHPPRQPAAGPAAAPARVPSTATAPPPPPPAAPSRQPAAGPAVALARASSAPKPPTPPVPPARAPTPSPFPPSRPDVDEDFDMIPATLPTAVNVPVKEAVPADIVVPCVPMEIDDGDSPMRDAEEEENGVPMDGIEDDNAMVLSTPRIAPAAVPAPKPVMVDLKGKTASRPGSRASTPAPAPAPAQTQSAGRASTPAPAAPRLSAFVPLTSSLPALQATSKPSPVVAPLAASAPAAPAVPTVQLVPGTDRQPNFWSDGIPRMSREEPSPRHRRLLCDVDAAKFFGVPVRSTLPPRVLSTLNPLKNCTPRLRGPLTLTPAPTAAEISEPAPVESSTTSTATAPTAQQQPAERPRKVILTHKITVGPESPEERKRREEHEAKAREEKEARRKARQEKKERRARRDARAAQKKQEMEREAREKEEKEREERRQLRKKEREEERKRVEANWRWAQAVKEDMKREEEEALNHKEEEEVTEAPEKEIHTQSPLEEVESWITQTAPSSPAEGRAVAYIVGGVVGASLFASYLGLI